MADRIESQGFFEMLWDCAHCDTKGLLAKSQRYCPNCGAEQAGDARYFPKEGEEQRVDGHKFVGADRVCQHCEAPQSTAATNCTHCGAPLDGSREVRSVKPPVAPPKRAPWWVKWLVLAVVVIVIALIYRACRTKAATLTVTGHRWERRVAVEQFGEVHGEAFEEELPHDARVFDCRTAPHPTRKVEDGEECRDENVDRGDGTFERVRKCTTLYRPADGKRCSYAVERWTELAPVVAAGTGLNATDPPASSLPPADASPMRGATRQRGRSATYTLEFGTQACSVPEAVWRKYADGAAVNLKVRAASGKIVCGDLR